MLNASIGWLESTDNKFKQEIQELSRSAGVKIVTDKNEIISAARTGTLNLLISEVTGLKIDNFQWLEELRANALAPKVPVILIASEDKEELCLEGIEAGADDYILAPFSKSQLLTRIKVNLKKHELQSGQQLERILDCLNCAFIAVDRQWRVIRINQEAASIVDRKPEEWIGKNYWEELPSIVGTEWEREYRLAMQEKVAVNFEAFFEPLDKWLDIRAYPLEEGLGICYRDITAGKKSGEERHRLLAEVRSKGNLLRQCEAFNQKLLESSNDCIKLLNLQGHLVYINPGARKLLEIEDLNLYLNLNWIDFWQGKDRQAAIEAIAVAKAGGEGKFQGYCPTAKGTPKWWEITVTPLLDEAGRVEKLVGISRDITERFKAKEALAESETRFRYLTDTAPVLVWMSGTDKLCNYVNQTWLDFTGRTIEQELGNGWTEGIYPEDRDRSFDAYANAFEARQRFRLEYRLKNRNGEYRWIWDIGVPRFTPEGNFLGYIGTCIDIHERKIAEEMLQETKERFRLALRASQTIAWDLDLKNERVVCSENALELWGFQQGTAEEFLAAIHPDDRPCLVRERERAIAEKTPYLIKYRVIDLDGNIRWLRSQGQVYFDRDGLPERLIGISSDITNLIQIQEALKESEARFRWIFESNIIALAFWDIDGNMIDANDAYLQMVGYARAEMQSGEFRWSVISTPEYNELYRQIFEELQQSGTSTPVKMHYIHKAGHRVPVLVGSAFRQGSQHDGVVFAIDLSERERVDREREQLLERERTLREAAESANRIKDEFLAVLSHELRSPLNPILGWSQLLRNDKTDRAMLSKGLETIERNVKLQIQLIDDLLDVSRILRGKLHLNIAPVNLAATVMAAIDTVRLAAQSKSIEIQTFIDGDVGQVEGDEARLQQIVWNLLTNAVKFTPYRGKVAVELQRVDRTALIRVKDTGKGISPEFLPYVFEQFRQADSSITRKFGGLGLGLAIARHLVELHGGEIKAESLGEGKGATFTASLPLSSVESFLSSNVKNVDESLTLSGLKILAIDDDPSTLEFLTFALEQYGATVTAVKSATEALTALHRIHFDLFLSDLGMPDIDGYTLIRQIRAELPEPARQIPAIALSAYARESDRAFAKEAGFQCHIAKPVNLNELIRCALELTKI